MKRPRSSDLKHQVFRSTAMQLAKEFLMEDPEALAKKGIDAVRIRYEPITQEALDQCFLWGSQAQLYPWEDVPSWKSRDRKAFDLSLWYDHELCGLCFATPKSSALSIKVVLLEAKPDVTHPLKGEVAGLVLIAIGRYARMLKLREIEAFEPDPGAILWYQRLGFDFDDRRRLVIAVNET
ncbi:N-acetyltransferase [Pseudomonas sp. AF32]|uniref:N-acetyltransferase n=1 Tax=Pseudomonas sp. AF32 TaxID=554390 RepID=UPI001EEEFA5A|nr:N-acetyltransferase [Pseudomonas sp. AF32]MCG6575563.1 N-acetyltransferase [Pseudomonas sp. AF32]